MLIVSGQHNNIIEQSCCYVFFVTSYQIHTMFFKIDEPGAQIFRSKSVLE